MGVFVPLKNVDEHDKKVVGQKAILLGQKSVSVPFSLVITSEVFDEFLKHNELLPDVNIMFDNREQSTEKLIENFENVSKRFMKASFPPKISHSLRECFELICLDTKSLDVLHGKKKQHSIISLRRSTTYNDQDINCPGTMYTKDNFDSFLDAIKSIFLSVYSPSSVTLRQKQEVEDFSVAIVATRLPNIKTCFESSYLDDSKKLFVSSYVGFIDKSKSVKRDFFDVAVEFLKINEQKIEKQTSVSVFDLHSNKPIVKAYDSLSSSQSATEQTILEIARLTKKIANEFGVASLMGDFIIDSDSKMYCLDLWTSKDVESLPIEREEPVELVQEPLKELHSATIRFLKEHQNTSYGDAIAILLRSLETDNSPQTLVQGLLMCKEILEH